MKLTRMKVYKFGGTSVGSAERIKALLPLTMNGDARIVVLSAMAGTTNELVKITELLFNSEKAEAARAAEEMRLAYHRVVNDLLSKPAFISEAMEMIDCHFEYIRGYTLKDFSKNMDRAIIAQGELISTALFRIYASEQGINATLLPALSYMRIDKDGEPDMYYITQNLKRELAAHKESQLIITQGFICRNAFGEVDNLKRGGSDYTATIIGAAINAEEVQIWTDINGVHNNDPRFVKNTSVIRQLSFDEAAELAYFGAKILHPSSVNPARQKNIPVRLKNTMEPEDEGTLIWTFSEGRGYKAVAAKDGITVVKIKSDRMLMAYGFLRKVFEIFEIYKTPIDMITTSEVAVSLTIDNVDNLGRIKGELEQFGTVEIDRNQSIICIVGNFIAEEAGTTLDIFSALKDVPVRMISYGGSRHNVSIVIDSALKTSALEVLSANLFNTGKDV